MSRANNDEKGTPPLTSSSRNANGTLAESEELMSKNDRICAFVNENDSISFAEVKGTSGVAVAMA